LTKALNFDRTYNKCEFRDKLLELQAQAKGLLKYRLGEQKKKELDLTESFLLKHLEDESMKKDLLSLIDTKRSSLRPVEEPPNHLVCPISLVVSFSKPDLV